jgi:threonine synthase
VVLFNTGAGLKYTDLIADAMHLRRPGPRIERHEPKLPPRMPVGGIITPQ